MLVSLSQAGNRVAFAELMARRQAWIRNLMRRCSGNPVLADDLAQQVFTQSWRSIRQLHDADRFGPWLNRMAINMWMQHRRKNDPLRGADEHDDADSSREDTNSVALDLDHALATLSADVRLCIVLSYHERMTHREIAEFMKQPLGTVKSHIRRGTKKLQDELAAYVEPEKEMK